VTEIEHTPDQHQHSLHFTYRLDLAFANSLFEDDLPALVVRPVVGKTIRLARTLNAPMALALTGIPIRHVHYTFATKIIHSGSLSPSEAIPAERVHIRISGY